MDKRGWVGLVMMLFAFSAMAAGPRAVRKQVEASMLVTGTIDVDAEGEVGGYVLDQVEKLPRGVAEFIDTNIAQWKFEPASVNGRSMEPRNRMSLRVVAKKLEDGNYLIRLHAVSFDALERIPGSYATGNNLTPPRYPVDAVRHGVSGTVYVLVKVDRDGKVQDALAEQINLRYIDTERQMERWREMFAAVSLSAARQWEFLTPTQGEGADEDYWVVRVPVDYSFPGQAGSKYGEWAAYVPGPRHSPSWRQEDAPGFSPDALPDDGIYQASNKGGLRLLTSLQQEG